MSATGDVLSGTVRGVFGADVRAALTSTRPVVSPTSEGDREGETEADADNGSETKVNDVVLVVGAIAVVTILGDGAGTTKGVEVVAEQDAEEDDLRFEAEPNGIVDVWGEADDEAVGEEGGEGGGGCKAAEVVPARHKNEECGNAKVTFDFFL